MILDAGHGNFFEGVNYTDPKQGKFFKHPDFIFYEGQYNRQILKKLAEKLEAEGFRYFIVSDEHKDTPRRERTARANAYARAQNLPSVFISIHGNAFTNPAVRGVEFFTHPRASANSKKLSGLINAQARKYLANITPQRGEKVANYQVLRETEMPAVLCEFGFFTNYEEAKLMRTEAWQHTCAQILVEAVKNFEL